MKCFNLFYLFVFLFLLMMCSASSSQKIFTDDFEGDLAAWIKPEFGGIAKDPNNPNNHALSLISGDPEIKAFAKDHWDLTDYTIEVKALIWRESAGGVIGLLFRAKDETTYYQMELSPGTQTIELKNPAGDKLPNTGQAEQVATVKTKVWYSLKLSCIGDWITGYVDGKKYIDVEGIPKDDDSGGFGFRAKHSVAYFDDVAVYGPGAVEALDKLGATWGGIKSRY
jgi:hypothetical protein